MAHGCIHVYVYKAMCTHRGKDSCLFKCWASLHNARSCRISLNWYNVLSFSSECLSSHCLGMVLYRLQCFLIIWGVIISWWLVMLFIIRRVLILWWLTLCLNYQRSKVHSFIWILGFFQCFFLWLFSKGFFILYFIWKLFLRQFGVRRGACFFCRGPSLLKL